MSRHDARRRDRRDRDSSSEATPPPRLEKPSRTGLQEYWIDGKGLNREVLQRQICFMLGNEARCRPDKYKGVNGYRVTAVRPFTEKQLEDLEEISAEYEREMEQHKKKLKRSTADLPYDQSRTSQRYDHPFVDPPRQFQDDRYGQRSYTGPVSSEGYPTTQAAYSQAMYSAPGRHSPIPLPPGSSGFGVPGYPATRPPVRDPREFQDPALRSPDSGPMYNPYGDDMDIDSGPPQLSHRPGAGYASSSRPPMGYPTDDRLPRDQYSKHNPYGVQPQPSYMEPTMPRYVPQGDPTGRSAMGMPSDFDDYRGPPMPAGYKPLSMGEGKRARHDDHRRR